MRPAAIFASLVLALVGHRPARGDDGQWTMPAKDYASIRFSGLDEIRVDNAKDLKVAWTFSTGVDRGQEAAPIVVGDTMYVVTPFPNILYALDLKNQGTMRWKYEPKPLSAAQGVACCDYVNRGCVFDGGRIFYNTLDCHTIAVDAKTGKEVWKTKVGDINKGESMTMAPLVVKGKVLVGNSGGEFGVRGWLTALDAKTGKVAWKAYSTGPDADCLIGPRFKPFYQQDVGKDLGVTTWPPDHWRIGGGTVWGWISYDPELNLIFYGTANPGTWNHELRPGENKWTCGIFARDPDTGEAVWFYQWSPHDLFDHDGINENLLLDLPLGESGAMRKVIVRPERNGHVYVLDRKSGQVLSATPFVRITASKGVDLATGKLIPNEEKIPTLGKVIRDVAPIAPGAKDWSPSAYSPNTGLVYMPHSTHVDGLRGGRGQLHRRHTLRRRRDQVLRRPGRPRRRQPGPAHGVEPGEEGGGVEDQGEVPRLVRRPGDGRRRRLLRDDGGLVQGRQRQDRGPALAVQDRLRDHRPADDLQGPRRQAIRGDPLGRRRLGRRDRRRRARPDRPQRRAMGFVNAMKDLPAHTNKGGTLYVFQHPVRRRIMARSRIAMLSLIVLINASVGVGDDQPRRVLKISADPNNLPVHQREAGRASRTGSPNSSPAR